MLIDSLLALGLTQDARVADVKNAYRTRAAAAHPDRGGSVEQFDTLNAAYNEALAWAQRVPCTQCNGAGRTRIIGMDLKVSEYTCGVCSGKGLRG